MRVAEIAEAEQRDSGLRIDLLRESAFDGSGDDDADDIDEGANEHEGRQSNLCVEDFIEQTIRRIEGERQSAASQPQIEASNDYVSQRSIREESKE